MTAIPTQSIPDAVGLVAGRGEFPVLVAKAARDRGVSKLVVVGINGDTGPEITQLADHVDWAHVGQLKKTIRAFQKQDIANVIFAGQIKPSRLFKDLRPDLKALSLLLKLRERNAETLFGAVAGAFEESGIHVLPSTTFMEDSVADEGVLTKKKPGKGLRADIDLGWRIAREVSRLDIGQTVVVKKGTVLAVEGFEGTDKAIKRGGELGFGGVTVIKVAKPNHDMRFDVPCIGMRTVESLIEARAKALAIQAGKTLILRRDEVLSACDENGIAVVGVNN